MTGLLIVREIFPEWTRLNEIPSAHVARIFFQHQQQSDLQVYAEGRDCGYLHIEPRRGDDGHHIVDFHGNTALNLPLLSPRRISWHGTMILDSRLEMQRLDLQITLQEPPHRLEMQINPKSNRASYTIRDGKLVLDSGNFTMDRDGVLTLLEKAGISRAWVPQLSDSALAENVLVLRAQQSEVKLSGETIATYLLSLRSGERLIFEAHITQLGQVLRAQVPPLGYKLAGRGLTP